MTEEERYRALDQEKTNAINQSNQTYDNLLAQNQAQTESVNKFLNDYQTTQNDIYDKQTAFNVGLQEQNKQKAEKEYQQEATASKNAYYDFVNPYGVQAEIQKQNGLSGSGYSESVKSQAWTVQQNRTAQARASLNNAKQQFDNAIAEAYLQNDTQKAQLALQILEQQQQESLRSFNYISDINQNRLANNQNLNNTYADRYNTLYSQIQNEKAQAEAIRQWEAEMAEKQRQYNESLAFQKQQAAQEQANWERQYALSVASKSGSGSSGSGSSKNGTSNNEPKVLKDETEDKDKLRTALKLAVKTKTINSATAKAIAEKYEL